MMVKDWRKSWRWFSVQLAALATALPLVWAQLPDDLKAYIPVEWQPFIVSAMGLAILIGRMIDQGSGE